MTWTSNGGTLSAQSGVTDDFGYATVTLTSSTTAGEVRVVGTSGNARSTKDVNFVAVAAAAIAGVSASPTSIVADGFSKSTISSVVKDAKGNLVPNVDVTWTTTNGTLDKTTSKTDANGVASVVLTSSTTAGTATVGAKTGAAQGSTTVSFVAPVLSQLTASPASIVADGFSTSIIKTVVTDIYGRPVPNITVTWTASRGTLSSATSVTDAAGVARVEVTSGTTADNVSIDATSGSLSGRLLMKFVAGDSAAAATTSWPNSIPADGVSTSTITTVVKDANGNYRDLDFQRWHVERAERSHR